MQKEEEKVDPITLTKHIEAQKAGLDMDPMVKAKQAAYSWIDVAEDTQGWTQHSGIPECYEAT